MSAMSRTEVLEVIRKAREEGVRPNLYGADLRGANLRGADLWGADLRGANLRGADLPTHLDILMVSGLPSGHATLTPWHDGWELRVGCWTGTPDTLEALIADDDGWPEAEGTECERRRPGPTALIAMCRAWIADHPDAVERAAEGKAESDRIRVEMEASR